MISISGLLIEQLMEQEKHNSDGGKNSEERKEKLKNILYKGVPSAAGILAAGAGLKHLLKNYLKNKEDDTGYSPYDYVH